VADIKTEANRYIIEVEEIQAQIATSTNTYKMPKGARDKPSRSEVLEMLLRKGLKAYFTKE